MIKIPSGTFIQGGKGHLALEREFPRHPVKVSAFYMDSHEVTNAEFREFVEATGYKTVAERPVDWEELKKQAPESGRLNVRRSCNCLRCETFQHCRATLGGYDP